MNVDVIKEEHFTLRRAWYSSLWASLFLSAVAFLMNQMKSSLDLLKLLTPVLVVAAILRLEEGRDEVGDTGSDS